MTTVAIMQPTYLPYLGYFHLIAASDVFVFLDDVQFARRSWQQRNRIMGPNGEVMLTVPVQKAPQETLIRDVEICDAEPWRERHLESIRHAYGKRPFFAEGVEFLELPLAQPFFYLSSLTCCLIQIAARRMGLKTEFVRSSGLNVAGKRSDHLRAILEAVGATDYLSPMGSQAYMVEDGWDFPVRYQSFVPVPYPQGREPFTPYMAFIDAVMNVGWEGTRGIIEQMRLQET